jgi:hypothetical protein
LAAAGAAAGDESQRYQQAAGGQQTLHAGQCCAGIAAIGWVQGFLSSEVLHLACSGVSQAIKRRRKENFCTVPANRSVNTGSTSGKTLECSEANFGVSVGGFSAA